MNYLIRRQSERYIIIEVNLKNKKGYLVSLYRSPNQNLDEFELFLTNLGNLLADITSRNPHFMLLLGETFSIRLPKHYLNMFYTQSFVIWQTIIIFF